MKTNIMAFFTGMVLVCSLSFSQFNQDNNPFYAEGTDISFQNQHWMFEVIEDTLFGSWSFMQPLPQAVYGVNSFYWAANGKVFVCGGNTQNIVPQSACYWYNPASDVYEPAASLPEGRWSGKLVRVRDSLYLIGSIDSSYNTADGLIYKYSLNENTWELKDTMSVPFVHECAVAVINDSLILTVGGSTNGLLSPSRTVRVYDPFRDRWSSGTPYPVNVTTAHAEMSDTVVYVLGGYSAGNLQVMYNGVIDQYTGVQDSLGITWSIFSTLSPQPFGQGVYRVAGGKWKDFMLFGPAMNTGTSVNQVWGLKVAEDTVWRRFMPNSIDTIGNISTYGVQSSNDSGYLYLFGGFKNPNVVNTTQKYTFYAAPPIGIISTSGNIPQEFKLYQNYPNPFNPVTKIKFSIAGTSGKQMVSITVYDVTGKKAAEIINEEFQPGEYETEFNASHLASGVYFYRLIISGEDNSTERIFSRKMILLK
jgi:hypothetical protein